MVGGPILLYCCLLKMHLRSINSTLITFTHIQNIFLLLLRTAWATAYLLLFQICYFRVCASVRRSATVHFVSHSPFAAIPVSVRILRREKSNKCFSTVAFIAVSMQREPFSPLDLAYDDGQCKQCSEMPSHTIISGLKIVYPKTTELMCERIDGPISDNQKQKLEKTNWNCHLAQESIVLCHVMQEHFSNKWRRRCIG